ncbi:hypothetical protein E1262_27260 [Jiangella aurantiaca]|uniref:Helix-turn-helix domain-containing protein n=1 Tax=Jiangella aurantiaca TaxID=2530373 RepID=A0A4R5A2L1_9ACTN|nr:hypothetical protein [Jiangella aurantiaca]TDD64789.1 hypothetical protein E1262_27260 [Jiangella aurantiaca]
MRSQDAPDSSSTEDEEPLPETPEERVAATRAQLLERTNRSSVPIRRTFVQAPRGAAARHGMLSQFVRNGDRRALDAYLMILALTSSGGPLDDNWTTTHPIRAWARLFGTTLSAQENSASNAVSKILSRLEDRQLIGRERKGRERKIQIRLLREDGSGEPYTRPKSADDRFLKLSHAYWLDGWIDKLSLPGLAMLLVALHERPRFQLPTEHVPAWYGWSADTAERGFDELRNHGLLGVTRRKRFEGGSPTGYVYVNTYELLRPFRTADERLKASSGGRTPAATTTPTIAQFMQPGALY